MASFFRRTLDGKVRIFVTPGYGETLHKARHFSQAVRIGDRVEISEQGGWNDELQIQASLQAEITQAFDNVQLADAGWANVVHVNSYYVGGFPAGMNEMMTKLLHH